MSTLRESYLPPPRSWDAFESIVFDVFTRRLQNPGLKRYGRSGQEQRGVDIVGATPIGGQIGIQCKNHPGSGISLSEIDDEIGKAETFTPALTHYVIATSAQRDAAVTAHVLSLSERRRRQGRFPVEIFFWEDIYQELARHPDLVKCHYPDLYSLGNPDQPSFTVTFANGKSRVELAADWTEAPPLENKMYERFPSRRPGGRGVSVIYPTFMWYTPAKVAGTVPLRFRIVNETAVEAKNVEVEILLPDGCRPVTVSTLETLRPGERAKAIRKDAGGFTVTVESLWHRPAYETDVFHVAFPTPGQTYALLWRVTAGTRIAEQEGTLHVVLLGKDHAPTKVFPPE